MQSVNELDKFRFLDALIMEAVQNGDVLELTLDAVVVKGNHPANETYTDRYADTMSLHFKQFSVLHAFKEGYKYYDASDTLIDAVPDEEVPIAAYGQLIKDMKDSHIFVLQSPKALKDKMEEDYPKIFDAYVGKAGDKSVAILVFDIEGEEGEADTTYWLAFSYEKAIASWHHFMNKAESN